MEEKAGREPLAVYLDMSVATQMPGTHNVFLDLELQLVSQPGFYMKVRKLVNFPLGQYPRPQRAQQALLFQ